MQNWHLEVSQGVVFDNNRCSLEIIESVDNYARYIFSLKKKHSQEMLFFRGHSQLNYFLQPGIKRKQNWLENEDIMYQELLVRCSQNFVHYHTHLDYLVEMQHYGLPTRLLDITENPLVALYFACNGHKDKKGQVYVLCAESQNVKYAKSDTVAVLSALPTLSYVEQKRLYKSCINGMDEKDDEEYEILAKKLAAKVKSLNPAFESRIRKEDLLKNAFVIPLRSNQRIVKQEGAFIICGIDGTENKLDDICCNDSCGRRIVLIVKDKDKILKELDILSVNRASLFPEIDDVAEYIREKYE